MDINRYSPVRWLPEKSNSSSSWSQCFNDSVDNGVALLNSKLAKCQSKIWRSLEDKYTSLKEKLKYQFSILGKYKLTINNIKNFKFQYNSNLSDLTSYSFTDVRAMMRFYSRQLLLNLPSINSSGALCTSTLYFFLLSQWLLNFLLIQ
jgi:hypothetical protein